MKTKPKILFAILFLITFTGCSPEGMEVLELIESKAYAGNGVESKALAANNSDTITIASFNIKWLSKNKIKDDFKGGIITETVSKFDIVAIQEIRDTSDVTMDTLEKKLADLGKDYDYIIGPLLPTDSTYRERYAFIFNTATIEKLSDGYTYPDSNDDFAREPLSAHFKAKNGNFDFVIVNIHTKPANADPEISDLPDAIAAAIQKFNEPDIITVGDYNADCARGGEYYEESKLKTVFPDTDYIIIIPNSADTNLASTDCTYDRIIVTKSTSEDYKGTWGVYRFDTIHSLTYEDAKKVSDHYPVWAAFHTNQDTD